jgi:putative ABC transport system permease protein
MIKNYLIIAIRNLWKYKLYSILNLLGLSLGLAVSILICIYIKKELSYDKHFSKANRTYRIVQMLNNDSGPRNWANGPPLMAEEIMDYIPEIEDVLRMRPLTTVFEYYVDSLTIITHEEYGGFFVDSTFFEFFDWKIVTGDQHRSIADPSSVVLSESLANKYFGDENPVGKQVRIAGGLFTVSAVMKDFPETTHFKPRYLLPWQTFRSMLRSVNLDDLYNSRHWAGVYTYVTLGKKTNAHNLEEKLNEFRVQFYSESQSREETIENGRFVFQPIADIHLRSHLEQEIEPNGNIIYITVFGLAALFILLIAGVNYVNIATTNALNRTNEVGIRKVNGAHQFQLIAQFIGEAVLTTVIAATLSFLIIDFFIPFFNEITESDATTMEILSIKNIVFIVFTALLFGILSGIYPAYFVSRFSPIKAIGELKSPVSATNRLRIALVILQFSASIFMIFSTIIIYRQMNFFLKKDLGMDIENVIIIDLNNQALGMIINNPKSLKNELEKLPFVTGTSAISHLPGDRFSVEGLRPDKLPDDTDIPPMRFLRVDEDFIELMGIQLVEGRNIRTPAEQESEFILNKACVKALNLEYPVGMKGTSYFGQHGEIVGICDDFHFASLHHVIEPLVLEINNDSEFRALWYNFLLVKVLPGNIKDIIDKLEKKIEEVAPGTVFNYRFLDENFNLNYKAELKLKALLRVFAIFAIFISCLGLFGLSSYSAKLKTKEIGIRKSHGAHTFGITILL